ncbi:MAG: sigma-54-dependent Fis family transcriptional regulator [Candidatus Omnitrophica bacterium]|nr:sigma-54-dependent Fis family transcriptional regulator [Candidatus Omnitrophota bacterium]
MTPNIKNVLKLLVVDDEPIIRESLCEALKDEGHDVFMASTAEEAMDIISRKPINVVISDYKLPKKNGLELLDDVKKESPATEFILITGYSSVEIAIESMKKGAYDYITKPVNYDEINIIIKKIEEKIDILSENKALKDIIVRGERRQFCGMIGGSAKIQNIYNIIDSVASTNATILISGESGTGKGLVAKAIHQTDQRRKNNLFVEVSCGALSETLLESELFGHVKGSFTGAIKDKEGRFEYAKGGTVFLDEIDSFPPTLQVKLLRVLQDGLFERVGDNVQRKADARIIVATNQDLATLVKEGKFREDLYYRVNVIGIDMPPLRERKEDIRFIVDHFVKKYSKINNKNIKGVSERVIQIFMDYSWPGNIRELENAVEGAVIMAKQEIISKEDAPNISKFYINKTEHNVKTLRKAVEDPEQEHIISVLDECGWSRNKAASILGINRTTLYNKMIKYNILEKEKK